MNLAAEVLAGQAVGELMQHRGQQDHEPGDHQGLDGEDAAYVARQLGAVGEHHGERQQDAGGGQGDEGGGEAEAQAPDHAVQERIGIDDLVAQVQQAAAQAAPVGTGASRRGAPGAVLGRVPGRFPDQPTSLQALDEGGQGVGVQLLAELGLGRGADLLGCGRAVEPLDDEPLGRAEAEEALARQVLDDMDDLAIGLLAADAQIAAEYGTRCAHPIPFPVAENP